MPSPQVSGENPFVLHELEFLDGTHGWADGLLETRDGGVTWVEYHICDKPFLGPIEFADEREGWAGGSWYDPCAVPRGDSTQPERTPLAALYHTTNGGDTWSEQSSEQIRRIGTRVLDLEYHRGGILWAVGSAAVVRSTDFGKTWTTVLEHDTGELSQGSGSGISNFVAVTKHGVVLSTQDSGLSWKAQSLKGEIRISDVILRAQYGVMAASTDSPAGTQETSSGVVFTTSDSGWTWRRAIVPTTAELHGVGYTGNSWLVVGDHGTILEGTPDGERWEQRRSPTSLDLWCVSEGPEPCVWIGGQLYTVLRKGIWWAGLVSWWYG